jgi:penicillin-insensitive murein endopeptidase
MSMPRRLVAALLLILAPAASAEPAKALFGAVSAPSDGPAQVLGGAAGGCLAGAAQLSEAGPGWQAMRLSRNRRWGHPETVAFVARLGRAAQGLGWHSILVGDLSQPRGGPMTFGHRSHQNGLDVDVWLRQPDGPLNGAARENLDFVSKVSADRLGVTPAFGADHAELIEAAARDPAADRLFVNPAIKAALCRRAAQDDRAWLGRVRPWWGHDSHFHVRLRCPDDSPTCVDQAPPPPGDGCDASLDWWFSEEALNPPPPKTPPPPRPDQTLADLPAACAALVAR